MTTRVPSPPPWPKAYAADPWLIDDVPLPVDVDRLGRDDNPAGWVVVNVHRAQPVIADTVKGDALLPDQLLEHGAVVGLGGLEYSDDERTRLRRSFSAYYRAGLPKTALDPARDLQSRVARDSITGALAVGQHVVGAGWLVRDLDREPWFVEPAAGRRLALPLSEGAHWDDGTLVEVDDLERVRAIYADARHASTFPTASATTSPPTPQHIPPPAGEGSTHE